MVKHRLRVATMESASGGLLANYFTHNPGASEGVAGPSEVERKSVGTFHIALDFLGQTRVVDSHWSTTRLELKRRAVMDALYILWRALEEREEPAAEAGVGGA